MNKEVGSKQISGIDLSNEIWLFSINHFTEVKTSSMMSITRDLNEISKLCRMSVTRDPDEISNLRRMSVANDLLK